MPDGIERGNKDMKKKIWITTVSVLTGLLLIIVACTKEKEPEKPALPTVPTGLSVTLTDAYKNAAGGYVAWFSFSWNEVKDANYYELYHSKNSSGPYECWKEYNYETNYDVGLIGNSLDEEIDCYVKVKAVNSSGSSSLSSFVHCHYSYYGGGNGGGGDGGSVPSTPTGVSAEVSGSRIHVTWNSVAGVSYYRVYKFTGADGYTILSETYSCYYYDESPITNNYYKIQAVNDYGESGLSESAFCKYSSGGGGGGGGSTTVPDAPTGVYAENVGNAMLPNIKISWNPVSNATSYKVYRSTSASGSYSEIAENTLAFTYDYNPIQGKNYYKVKAFNSAGGSSYSSYAMYNYNPSSQLSPCPVHYTSHTATSSKITLRWTNPTSSGCGKPTTAYLKVKDPDTDEYVVIETMPGTDTWASFSYTPWIDVFQGQRWVYCGIITENSAGISGGLALAYNVDTNTWYGGNGLKLTEEMEKELEKIEY